MGIPYNPKMVRYVHSASVGKGASVQLQQVVAEMCDDLTRELKSVCSWLK